MQTERLFRSEYQILDRNQCISYLTEQNLEASRFYFGESLEFDQLAVYHDLDDAPLFYSIPEASGNLFQTLSPDKIPVLHLSPMADSRPTEEYHWNLLQYKMRSYAKNRLDIIMISELIRKWQSRFPSDNQLIRELFPLLRLSQSGPLLKALMQFSQLPHHEKLFFSKRGYSVREIEEPLSLPPGLRQLLYSYLELTQASHSQTRHFFRICRDILERKRSETADLERYIQSRIAHQEAAGQPSKKYLDETARCLNTLCYPEQMNFLDRYQTALKKISFPDKVKLDIPMFFEEGSMSLQIPFHDAASLARALEQTTGICQSQEFASFLGDFTSSGDEPENPNS